jgi:hypothetical protein
MHDPREAAACPFCGQVGRVAFTTRQQHFTPPHRTPPVTTLSQCRACGAIFAKSEPAEHVAAEHVAVEEAVGAY